MDQKVKKKFLVLKIIACESGAASSDNTEQNTCHRQAMFEQPPLRFHT